MGHAVSGVGVLEGEKDLYFPRKIMVFYSAASKLDVSSYDVMFFDPCRMSSEKIYALAIFSAGYSLPRSLDKTGPLRCNKYHFTVWIEENERIIRTLLSQAHAVFLL